MTNVLFSITVALATNWTGINNSSNEIGYVVTNTAAVVVFEGKTNTMLLKEEIGSLLVLRPMPVITNYISTNIWWNVPQQQIYLTNLNVFQNALEAGQ